MNGNEFLKRVKEIKPEIKVFLMTAFEIDYSEIRRLLPSVTIDEFIRKPISANTLISRIRKYIKKESDADTVDTLNLPAALKNLLRSHGLTTEQLQNMKSSEIAQTLAIDDDTARIIIAAVRGKSDSNIGH
jgi:response regulator RpfG family c-di-GMP phosphodiesterase